MKFLLTKTIGREFSSNNTNTSTSGALKLPRDALDEILIEISMDPNTNTKVSSYLSNIETKISEINKYQSKKNPKNFYNEMRAAMLEIRNIANALHELFKLTRPSLSNSLKELLLSLIIPLETELEKRLEMLSMNEEFKKTRRFYAEQSFVSRNASSRKALMRHLDKVKALLDTGPPSCCYIGYAPPSDANKEKEYWVQPFLWILYDHLKTAGIQVLLDIRDEKAGNNRYQFIKQCCGGNNYIILVGTESLLQKHYSTTEDQLQTMLSMILQRLEQDQNQFGQTRVYPMLISGNLKTAYPESYKYIVVKDAREGGYIKALRELIDWIYEHRVKVEEHKCANLWRTFNQTFNQNYPGLPKEPEAVESEIDYGYHREDLQSLTQSIEWDESLGKQKTCCPYFYSKAKTAIKLSALAIGGSLIINGLGSAIEKPSAMCRIS